MSVPWRHTAVEEYGDARAHCPRHFRQAIDGGAQGLRRASAVVRNQKAVRAMLHREFCIFRAVDSFEHDLHLGQFLKPVECLPGRIRWIKSPGKPVIHRPSDRVHFEQAIARLAADGVACGTVAGVLPSEADHCGSVASGQKVDGPNEHWAARILDALDHFLRLIPSERHIELLPWRCTEGL
jgi:hypothetical protein